MKLDDATLDDAYSVVQEINEVVNVLNDDQQILIDYVSSSPHRAFWIRTSIRNFFADTEARIYQLRRFCLALHSLGVVVYSAEEIVCLQDKVLRIDSGAVVTSPAKTRTTDNFLFAFRMFARAIEADDPIDPAREPEWALFKDAIKIRDRLTHPKTQGDLHVTDDEVANIAKVMGWFEAKRAGIAEIAMERIQHWRELDDQGLLADE